MSNRHSHMEPLNKVRKQYIIELADGVFDYINDHVDQNIANRETTNFNVMAEMVAGFLIGFSEKKDQQDVLQDLVNMIIHKVENYEEILRENFDEE